MILIPTLISPHLPLKTLTYLAPAGLTPGIRVIINVRNTLVFGVVIGIDNNPPKNLLLKPVAEILDPFLLISDNLWKLINFASNYYNCNIAEILNISLPWNIIIDWKSAKLNGYKLGQLRNENNWKKLEELGILWKNNNIKDFNLFKNEKSKNHNNINIEVKRKLNIKFPKLAKIQNKILPTLKDNFGKLMLEAMLCKENSINKSIITKLVNLKSIKHINKPKLLNKKQIIFNSKNITLSENQEFLVKKIIPEKFKTYLLYGINGSDKLTIYLKLTEQTIARGKRVLWLVPEVSLIINLLSKIEQLFPNQTVFGHHGSNKKEKVTGIFNLLNNNVNIFIGVRNAVLVPINNIGLIIVDEEHDNYYKNNEYPRINARDLAIKRAQLESCPIILGSTTPSLESWHATKNKRYELLQITDKPIDTIEPIIQIVDLKECYKQNQNKIIISDILLKSIHENLIKGEQIMLLVNHRNFENFWICHSCGKTLDCPRCTISLNYHKKTFKLICHLCGLKTSPFKKCNHCNTEQVLGIGEETIQVEDYLKTLFPKAKILRIEKDKNRIKNSINFSFLNQEYSEADIIVGTKMPNKRFNLPKLSLIGIINIDLDLRINNFRSGEFVFQSLTKLLGQAGRCSIASKIILQTYNPNHTTIVNAITQDFEKFSNQELAYRKALEYPPYTTLLLYRNQDINPELAIEPLKKLRTKIEPFPNLRILGPVEAPIAKVNGYYRMQLIIKSYNRKQLSKIIKELNLKIGGSIIIDRDPINF